MSTIEKLSIQGVRSFGANSEDCQVITFSSPITLILGENGCGKTTIIECLKHALTGEMPPGSDRGKSFVHDPKIEGRVETLSQIKLQVRDKRGARLSVCRSMKVFNKHDKFTYETLNPTLNFLGDGDGKNKQEDSLCGRIVDVDTALCDFMGVSKAIINNVLFCHQEDSSWPLDEPKKLKEKFDSIFGITEYDKALDKIIKMRKEAKDELKVMEANMKYLQHLKEEMDQKTLNLQKAQEKCDAIKKQCSECDEEVKPIDVRLTEIRNIEFEIGKYQAQKVEMETKHKNCADQIGNITKKIKNLFKGTLVELDVEISSFDQKMSELRFERSEMEDKMSKLKSASTEMQKTLATQDKNRYMLQQQYKSEENCKSQLVNGVKSICDQLQILVPGDLVDKPQKISDLLNDIDESLMSKQCDIAELATRNDQADQTRQAKIDELRVDLTKSEEGVLAQDKQKLAYEKESESLARKIEQIETSLQKLKILDKEISKADEMYERTTRSFNVDALREQIAMNKSGISEKETHFKKVDEQLTFLNSMAKIMAEINLKKTELDKKQNDIQRIKSKHNSNFGKLFKDPITSNYRRAVQNIYEKLKREIKNLNENANAAKLNAQSHEIKRKNLKSEIALSERELTESEELIFQICHSVPYEDLVERSKIAISKLQLEHGALKNAELFYKQYINKIEDQPCCPLCHHNMSDDQASDLTSELTDEIQKLPENIAAAEKGLKAENIKYEKLLNIKPTILKVRDLKKNVPQKKEELRKIEQMLVDTENEYETQMALLGEPTHNMDLANSMLSDMTILDEASKEMGRLGKDLELLKKRLPESYDGSVSIDELQAQKKQVSQDLEAERKTLETNQQTYEKQMDSLNRLREMKNSLKAEQIKLQEGVQSLPQLKERLDEVTRLLITLGTAISELKAKINPLKQNLKAAITEKARLKDSEKAKLDKLSNELNTYRSAEQNIQRLSIQAQDYAKLKLKTELIKSEGIIEGTRNKMKELETEIVTNSELLEAIKVKCLNQQTVERDLKDNRELKQLQQKEIELKANCETLGQKLGNLDFHSIAKEKNVLAKKRDTITVRRGELLGQQGEIRSQVDKLTREIEEPKYKQSLENYRRAHYELLITGRTIEDLGQHRVALEWALIKFHSEKMEKINTLIRQYWRMIYRGNDIDYIQIETDPGKNTSADRRKTYNYRVMQSKSSSMIEMRGRCSAGQRVLASLIIRMALAETFSCNCGVLALDEPTTNLDQQNISSLCYALNRIVEERQTQSNFMLIIITHDENFISSLGKIDGYHRVRRNGDCKSEIRKVRA